MLLAPGLRLGQPFGESGLDHDGFIYDTDPAARAVVPPLIARALGSMG